MQLTPYISFNGNCAEAFRFYNHVLGGEIVAMIPHTGTPAETSVPPEWRDKIMHAALRIGDQWLMGVDPPPGNYHKPSGFCVSVQIGEPAEADRIFQALSEAGRVTMPIQKTFWALRFGMLVDRFDVPWMVNCGEPM